MTCWIVYLLAFPLGFFLGAWWHVDVGTVTRGIGRDFA